MVYQGFSFFSLESDGLQYVSNLSHRNLMVCHWFSYLFPCDNLMVYHRFSYLFSWESDGLTNVFSSFLIGI